MKSSARMVLTTKAIPSKISRSTRKPTSILEVQEHRAIIEYIDAAIVIKDKPRTVIVTLRDFKYSRYAKTHTRALMLLSPLLITLDANRDLSA